MHARVLKLLNAPIKPGFARSPVNPVVLVKKRLFSAEPLFVAETEREKRLVAQAYEKGRKESRNDDIEIGRTLERFQNPNFQKGYEIGWRDGVKDKRSPEEKEKIIKMNEQAKVTDKELQEIEGIMERHKHKRS